MKKLLIKIVLYMISRHKEEMLEQIRVYIREHLAEYKVRAEKSPNPIDDFVIEIIEDLLNIDV